MSTAERFTGGRGGATPAKWINAGPDEGALHALLDRILERVPRERIDLLWVFPTRTSGGVESTVVVIAAYDEDPERRTVATAHFRVTRDRRGRATVALEMQEHGSAPVGATQRVVDGVLRRLGDEVGREAPRREEIRGDEHAWRTFHRDIGGPEAEAPAEQETTDPAAREETRAEERREPEDRTPKPQADDRAETPPHGDPLHEQG